MSQLLSCSFPWADGTYSFRLPIGQLRELQEKCSAGPFELYARLKSGMWRADDLRETIRLGLIGGGSDPLKALALVSRYVDERPLLESVAPAEMILLTALSGPPSAASGKEGADETAATDASTSPPSTEPERL